MFDLNFKNFNPRNFSSDGKRIFFEFKKNFLQNKKKTHFFLVATLFFSFIYIIFIAPPAIFPLNKTIHIDEGKTLGEISLSLEQEKIINSSFVFKYLIKIFGREKGIISGDYFFEKPSNIFLVAYRMTEGKFGLIQIRITLYEGMSSSEMGKELSKKFNQFSSDEFNKIIKENNLEGKLFPDTYFFLPNIKAIDVVQIMERNFNKNISLVEKEIKESGKSLDEIITMASILEDEAKTSDSKKIISGILWKRLEIGMPLQVDAVFPYIINKNTYQLTKDDLQIDSEYNTYRYKGLPPGPITNPGMDSIIAAISPNKTNYLFYLSDRQGNMYYATDFEGHKKNKILYLN